MSCTTATAETTQSIELVTFRVNDILMGIDIRYVQEINRQCNATHVPHAPRTVCGVINLRGDVVTVLDLRRILELPDRDQSQHPRTIVLMSNGERIGLLVDSISDVIATKGDQILPPPASLSEVESRCFEGVVRLDHELLLVLNIEQTLS